MSVKTILVEDSATIRDTLVPAMAELADVEILAWAETASEGVAALIEQHEWQLIVVDLFLREGTGLEVLRACTKRLPGRRAVVLTNYATAAIRKECIALGADAVFDKSTELDDFFAYCASIS